MQKKFNLIVLFLGIIFIVLGYVLGNIFSYFLYAFAVLLIALLFFVKVQKEDSAN